jgi:hypothetical protein
MPSRPPETPFYQNSANHELWRDLSRLFEDFVGDSQERKAQFITVVEDVLVRLRENANGDRGAS